MMQRAFENLGYKEASIWTWTEKEEGACAYVTGGELRGLRGDGAASRFSNVFYSNPCSVSEYVKAVDAGKLPIALCTALDRKAR